MKAICGGIGMTFVLGAWLLTFVGNIGIVVGCLYGIWSLFATGMLYGFIIIGAVIVGSWLLKPLAMVLCLAGAVFITYAEAV